MSIATARAELAAALSADLPEFSINSDLTVPDEFTRPALVLIRTRVRKTPSAPNGYHENTFSLWVIVPQHAGEDALDEALESTLAALDDHEGFAWEDAERDVWDDSAPAYRITFRSNSRRTS